MLKKIGIHIDNEKPGEISMKTDKKEPKKEKGIELTDKLAKKIGEKLGIDFEVVTFEDWKSGIKAEV